MPNKMEGCVRVEKMNPEALETLEAEHVHKFYSEAANHFSETRHKAWPEVAAFINSLAPGSLLADIGKWSDLSLLQGQYFIY